MPWNTGLTPEQSEAAAVIGRHGRLLAGPGTGKTRTLTRHAAWLVDTQGILPTEILVLTFTRAATAHLRNEIGEALTGSVLPRISTLHSFALRQLLRTNADQPERPLRIADDFEERWIVQEELKNILHCRVDDVQRLLNQLSADWQQLTADTPGWEQRFPNPAFLGAWQEHRAVYGYTLRSELVYQLKRALEEGGVNLEGSPKHVLVDEYQDLNACDLAVVHRISQLGAEVYGAGDDDQSIYGFRYAEPEGIRRFELDYSPNETKTLEECHRCAPEILEYALYVARQDPRRIDKQIKPGAGAPPAGQVHLLRFERGEAEATSIANLCKWLIDTQGVAPERILILIRSDRQQLFSDPVRQALQERGVPSDIVTDPWAPLNESHGREALSLLRLALNQLDHLAWRALLQVRSNGIAEGTFRALYEMSRMNGWRFADTLAQVSENPQLLRPRGEAVAREQAAILELLEGIGQPTPGELEVWLSAAIELIIPDAEARAPILDLLQRARAESSAQTLDDLLRGIGVSLGESEQATTVGSVPIMTMHQAKGLSADAAVVMAAEDEYIPGMAAGRQADDERRLLYVSLTRARRFLFVTYATRRHGQQRFTGRNRGDTSRTLTTFLRGGPYAPEDGVAFVNGL